MKIEHFAFNVKDPVAMADWYVANLGMKIVRSGPEPINIRFLADDNNETLIEIYTNPLGNYVEYKDMHPVTFHIAFTVDDIQAEIDRLVAAGGTWNGEIETTALGDQLTFVRDPWGYPVQLAKRKNSLV